MAQQAEDDLVSVQRIAREAVGLSQAFVSGGLSVTSAAFPSQAEKTLAKYSYKGSGASTEDQGPPTVLAVRMAKWVSGHASAVKVHILGLSSWMGSISSFTPTRTTRELHRMLPGESSECGRTARSVIPRT